MSTALGQTPKAACAPCFALDKPAGLRCWGREESASAVPSTRPLSFPTPGEAGCPGPPGGGCQMTVSRFFEFGSQLQHDKLLCSRLHLAILTGEGGW